MQVDTGRTCHIPPRKSHGRCGSQGPRGGSAPGVTASRTPSMARLIERRFVLPANTKSAEKLWVLTTPQSLGARRHRDSISPRVTRCVPKQLAPGRRPSLRHATRCDGLQKLEQGTPSARARAALKVVKRPGATSGVDHEISPRGPFSVGWVLCEGSLAALSSALRPQERPRLQCGAKERDCQSRRKFGSTVHVSFLVPTPAEMRIGGLAR